MVAMGDRFHILIVDDAETVRKPLRQLLEMNGFRVSEASNGIEGLAVARANASSLKLVIADYNMPQLDGISMAAKLRAEKLDIPTVILTTELTSELKARAKSVGAKAWILKPYHADVLLETIKVLLHATP